MKIATSDTEILECFTVLSELRPQLDKNVFLPTIRAMQSQGYSLCYLLHEDEVVSVAGYRIYFELSVDGNTLYVYELVTAEKHRSKDYGKQLLSELKQLAIVNKCKALHLDSNTNRHGAHKFYLRNGFHIGAFHFLEMLV